MTEAVKAAIRWLLGLGLIGFLAWSHRAELFEVAAGGVDLGYVLAAFAVCLLATLVTIQRWHALLRVQGFDHGIADTTRIGLIGVFFNYLVPGSVGGDVVRAAMLGRRTKRLGAAAASVLIDRALGLTSLACVTVVCALAFWPENASMSYLVPVAAAGGFVATSACGFAAVLIPGVRSTANRVLAHIPLIGGKLSSLLETASVYRSAPATLASAFAIGIVAQLGFVLALRLAALAIGPPLPDTTTHFAIAPSGLMFAIIPLTPAGLGLVDAAIVELFAMAGMVAARGLLMMMLYRAAQISVALIGGVFFLLTPSAAAATPPDPDQLRESAAPRADAQTPQR